MMNKELILIVEDDLAISKMLHYTLTQDGYRCIVSDSLKSALRIFQTHNPEIILLDLGLPDGDGKLFIKAVREETMTPIIVISARHDEHEIVAALDAGADDYVLKPFSDIELSIYTSDSSDSTSFAVSSLAKLNLPLAVITISFFSDRYHFALNAMLPCSLVSYSTFSKIWSPSYIGLVNRADISFKQIL